MKLISKTEAVKLIKDGAHITTTGFIGSGHPQTISSAIEGSFLSTGHPRDLTYQFSAGVGDNDHRGNNYYGHAGLLKRVIGAHFATAPRLGEIISDNKIEAYNLPQGVMAHLFRAAAGKKPGILTKVGLKTYVDPRLEGGKLNEVTKEDIVKVMEIDGEEYLYYKVIPTDVSIIRASTADEKGNLSMEREAVITEAFSIAAAAKANKGIVIAEVERLAEADTIAPKNINVPGSLVDYVVVGDHDKFMITNDEYFNPAYTGEIKVPLSTIPVMPLNQRKIIARRAALELTGHERTNLGIGMPEGVASVAAEEGIGNTLLMTVESGSFGGLPASGGSFGATIDAEATICHTSMFDFYDGGNLDVTFLGLAEVDSAGNINVSKFGKTIAGCGGFINISQNTPKLVFCGTLTAGGLKVDISNGELKIRQEGRKKKFVKHVQQITFSGDFARETGQKALYVTERAVFELGSDGLVLTEIAPGVDLQKDVLDQVDADVKVSDNLKKMDARIFQDAPMGISSAIICKTIKGVA